MTFWGWFGVYYAVAMVAFGVCHVRWYRRQVARGEKVPTPITQFVWGVLLAPLALALLLNGAWYLIQGILGAIARL